jgi:predicted NAD/FAD-binding protein
LTKDEAKVLNQVHFSKNTAVLHCDEDLMPKRRKAWSSWNYLTHDPDRASSKSSKVCLTYWMNLLQNINVREHGNVFVTMNPIYEPKKEKVIETYEYEHPLYTPQLVEAQRLLRSVNAVAKYETKTIYAGAWTLNGFHEDGLTSGLRAASLLGAQCPFEIIDATNIRPLAPTVSHDVTGVVLEFIEYVFLWMWRIIDFLLVLTFPLRNTRSIIKTNMRGRI